MPPCSAMAITRKAGGLLCAARTPWRGSDASVSSTMRTKMLFSEARRFLDISVRVNRPFRRGQLFCGHGRVKFQIEEADHHFVPALLSPNHGLCGIRVLRIVRR